MKRLDPCCNGIPLNHSILLMVSLSNLISFHISILSIFLILMLIYIDMREIFANHPYFQNQLLVFSMSGFCKLLMLRGLSMPCFSQMMKSSMKNRSLAKFLSKKWTF